MPPGPESVSPYLFSAKLNVLLVLVLLVASRHQSDLLHFGLGVGTLSISQYIVQALFAHGPGEHGNSGMSSMHSSSPHAQHVVLHAISFACGCPLVNLKPSKSKITCKMHASWNNNG